MCRASQPGLSTCAGCSFPSWALAISSFQVRVQVSAKRAASACPNQQCFPNVLKLFVSCVGAPGLLVAYCSRFDVRVNSRNKVYFISCCTGTRLLTCAFCRHHLTLTFAGFSPSAFALAYLLGLVLTFAVMLLSGMGQPALLYLVPFTLVTAAAVAGYRKEMRHFWTGSTYEVRASKPLQSAC